MRTSAEPSTMARSTARRRRLSVSSMRPMALRVSSRSRQATERGEGVPGERRTRLWIALVVVALALAPYLPTLGHGFVHDDHLVILDNPVVVEERFGELLALPYHVRKGVATDLYRPLTT